MKIRIAFGVLFASLALTPTATAAPGETAAHKKARIERLHKIKAAAQKLADMLLPYLWAGGHETVKIPDKPLRGGLDCSGAVCYVLQHAGYNLPSMDTTLLIKWGEPGKGRHVTIWVRPEPGHTCMEIDGKFFESSGRNIGGPRWIPKRDLKNFVPRHPVAQ